MVARPIYTEVSMMDLERLMDDVQDGAVAIPDFQREFVWTTQMVKSLIATIIRGWPIGTLLLTRGDLQEFRLKPLEGAPPVANVKYVVLDGQQRLTALYTALRGAGETVFAVNFAEHIDADERELTLEERLVGVNRVTWQTKYARDVQQLSNDLMPLTALASPAAFFAWRDRLLAVSHEDSRASLSSRLTEFYKSQLAAIHRATIPVVFLETSLDVATVATIFEKLNRSGMRLGTFDLMVARVYEYGWNLRDQWDRARIERPLLEAYLGEDAMPVLQAIALRRLHDVRQDAVLSLRDQVRKDWESAVEAAEAAVDFLVGCGVDDRTWLPYGSQLVALTALAMDSGDLSQRQALLERWFWARSFGQGFDVAANTRIVTDYRHLRTGGIPLDDVSVEARSLLSATKQSNRAIWGATLSLLTQEGGYDVLGLENVRVHSVSDPDAPERKRFVSPILPKVGAADRAHLLVLNLVIAGRRSTSLIRRAGLRQAAEAAALEVGEPEVERALAAQLLPTLEDLRSQDLIPERLLEYRLDLLMDRLAKRGVHVLRE